VGLDVDDVHHIAIVLRMKAGEELLLCDGQGTEYSATITAISRTELKAEIISIAQREIIGPRITLGQGLPKSDKMDLIVQKATELGAANIIPLVTERTIVKIRDEEKKIARWQKIAREAAMQSNRPDIPQVNPIQPFPDFLMTRAPGPLTLLLFPWEESAEPIKNVFKQSPNPSNIIVLIGPEGGFSLAEAEQAKSRGFHPVSLGRNILRTETASLAVLSIITYAYS